MVGNLDNVHYISKLTRLVRKVKSNALSPSRQDLADLIDTAFTASYLGATEQNQNLSMAAQIAYKVASEVFREQKKQVVKRGRHYWADDESNLFCKASFCASRVSEYSSLDALETAAELQIKEIDEAWRVIFPHLFPE